MGEGGPPGWEQPGEQRSCPGAPAPDPAAPNGGRYQLELYPQQTKHLTIAFTMPDTKRLLIRRQPELTPADLTVTSPGCQTPFTATLTSDITLDLGSLCW